MSDLSETRRPVYHHFVLLVWEERAAEGSHMAWRFSLQDSQQEARIGFKNLDELITFLERWMEFRSEDDSNKKETTK
jgi:hypothetical protein